MAGKCDSPNSDGQAAEHIKACFALKQSQHPLLKCFSWLASTVSSWRLSDQEARLLSVPIENFCSFYGCCLRLFPTFGLICPLPVAVLLSPPPWVHHPLPNRPLFWLQLHGQWNIVDWWYHLTRHLLPHFYRLFLLQQFLLLWLLLHRSLRGRRGQLGGLQDILRAPCDLSKVIGTPWCGRNGTCPCCV